MTIALFLIPHSMISVEMKNSQANWCAWVADPTKNREMGNMHNE